MLIVSLNNTPMKKFSIITINYNNCVGLRKTIESVVNQTYTDFEYIVIDGGSTDGSVEVIREYADRIDYWVSEPDKGIYNAMNKGILKATGEYLNFMNSGDCFHSSDVLRDISMYNEDVVLGKYKRKDYDGGLGFYNDNITMTDLCKGNINHQSAFIKRSFFENSLYDENYKIVSDWKFFIEILVFQDCSFRNLDIIVVDYDVEGLSSTNAELSLQERTKILESMFPPRILADYELLKQIKGSPLLKSVAYLNCHTTRFNLMIAKLVDSIVWMYSFFKR